MFFLIPLSFFFFIIICSNFPSSSSIISSNGIKDDSECLYCGEQDCSFTKDLLSKVVQWFNNCNQSFEPTNQEFFFGIFSNPANKEILKKINYTLLFARYFIYTNKLHNNSLLITDFVSKVSFKYRLENLD